MAKGTRHPHSPLVVPQIFSSLHFISHKKKRSLCCCLQVAAFQLKSMLIFVTIAPTAPATEYGEREVVIHSLGMKSRTKALALSLTPSEKERERERECDEKKCEWKFMLQFSSPWIVLMRRPDYGNTLLRNLVFLRSFHFLLRNNLIMAELFGERKKNNCFHDDLYATEFYACWA